MINPYRYYTYLSLLKVYRIILLMSNKLHYVKTSRYTVMVLMTFYMYT